MNSQQTLLIKRFLAAASLALAVPLSAAAFDGGRDDGCGKVHRVRHEMPGGGLERPPPHWQRLNLTEAQRDKIFTIMHAQMPALREQHKAMRQAEEALRTLSMSGDFSEAKAKKLSEASAKAATALALSRASTDHQIFELLTDEQRKQLAEAKMPDKGPGADGPRSGRRDPREPFDWR